MFDHVELQIGYVYQHALRSVLFIYCHIYIESACVTLSAFAILNLQCRMCSREVHVCSCMCMG